MRLSEEEKQTIIDTYLSTVRVPRHIHISGKRWFQRTYGNTYFSSKLYLDGFLLVKIPYEYGYGEQYLDRVFDELEKTGIIKDREHYENGACEAAWRYCQRKNIKFTYDVADVSRKKDL